MPAVVGAPIQIAVLILDDYSGILSTFPSESTVIYQINSPFRAILLIRTGCVGCIHAGGSVK